MIPLKIRKELIEPNDSQMSIRVANNAISSARNFTWNNNALNYIELFNDITKSGK